MIHLQTQLCTDWIYMFHIVSFDKNFKATWIIFFFSWCLVNNLFVAAKNLSKLTLDELDELEDSEDEAVLLEYRNKRISELKALAERKKFGTVEEISAQDYVKEVTKAGEGIWVILHLYKQG